MQRANMSAFDVVQYRTTDRPGTWSSAYSDGLRTSMMVSDRFRSRMHQGQRLCVCRCLCNGHGAARRSAQSTFHCRLHDLDNHRLRCSGGMNLSP